MAQCKTRQECLDWLRSNAKSVAPGQDVVVDFFQPDDAEGVARLYYAIYGDTFAIDYVYDPKRICEANQGPDLHHVVARTGAGEVVGISALFRVPPGKGILEAGGLMLLPEYRLGTLLFRLIDLTQQIARDRLHLNAVFGQSVTDHLTTQKINARYGYRGLALEMESMPARPEWGGGRISLLNEFLVLNDIAHPVYLPQAYAPLLREMYVALGLGREFLGGAEPKGNTAWDLTEMPAASLAKILVTEIGTDFPAVLRKLAEEHPELHAMHLQLPLTHFALPWAVEQARAQGFCLGGLLPLWTDRDVLLLQKLAKRPDFTAPALLTEGVQGLLEQIRLDWENVARP
ncbi:MAG: GNAT family N-acetyltransferase [Proteobacteria bacterium]|nr:GNAT family N-acetyltransferase [Pseudomonadota bacterium]